MYKLVIINDEVIHERNLQQVQHWESAYLHIVYMGYTCRKSGILRPFQFLCKAKN